MVNDKKETAMTTNKTRSFAALVAASAATFAAHFATLMLFARQAASIL